MNFYKSRGEKYILCKFGLSSISRVWALDGNVNVNTVDLNSDKSKGILATASYGYTG